MTRHAGPSIDVVTWHDGSVWRCALDTSDFALAAARPGGNAVHTGALRDFEPLTDFKVERRLVKGWLLAVLATFLLHVAIRRIFADNNKSVTSESNILLPLSLTRRWQVKTRRREWLSSDERVQGSVITHTV